MPQLNCHGQAIHGIIDMTVVAGSNHQSIAHMSTEPCKQHREEVRELVTNHAWVVQFMVTIINLLL